MKQVGKIHGPVKPTTFQILLSDLSTERGSYIKVNHDVYGWVLAKIESMKRYLDDFDDEVMLAEARTIGFKQDNNVLIPKTPFKPGEKVYTADKSLIMSILGLCRDKKDSMYVGMLEGHDIPVYLDVKKTIGKHTSVLAKTGAGKSYTVAVLLEELIKNDVAIVIIDPHGEYGSLRIENDDYDAMLKYNIKAASYADKVVEYATNRRVNPNAGKLILPSDFDLIELTEIMPMSLGDRQKSTLYSALRDLEGERYTLKDLMVRVEQEPTQAKWKVMSGLEGLDESGIFEGDPIALEDLVQKGQATIINLLGTEHHIQELVVAKLARMLFDGIRVGKIPEFFFLVEEAHNFCPERGFGDSISSSILRDIASEGRKFGFHLCVVSQRPARVDKNVLSQCNTQIILKVTNPNDLRAISHSIEGFTPGMEKEIRQLSVGHALIVGESVEQPITVDIRVRETKHHTSHVRAMVAEQSSEEDDVGETFSGEDIAEESSSNFLRLLKRIFLK
ncbi:MAG: ATP-binding protein [Methanobacteriota archaeon]